MKTIILSIIMLMTLFSASRAQTPFTSKTNPAILQRQLTTEPAIGLHINAGMDLLLSNLVQWNLKSHWNVAAHTSFNINNIAGRELNQVKTEYNNSFNQKIGVGRTLYGKKSSHTFLLMGGVKYTAYKEALENPGYEQAIVSVSSWSPDYGIMYSLKKGVRNCFFSFRLYLPLYPWPLKGTDINYADGNLDNVAIEFGVGFKLK